MDTAWFVALAFRQSRVAKTSFRFTLAPGRTRTVSTYTEMNWGPTSADTQGSSVPTYIRVGRKVAAFATVTVTGFALLASATLFTFDSAREMRRPPTARTTSTPPPMPKGIAGDRVTRAEGLVRGRSEACDSSAIISVPSRSAESGL